MSRTKVSLDVSDVTIEDLLQAPIAQGQVLGKLDAGTFGGVDVASDTQSESLGFFKMTSVSGARDFDRTSVQTPDFDTVVEDEDGGLSLVDGTFTAIRSGFYLFEGKLSVDRTAGSGSFTTGRMRAVVEHSTLDRGLKTFERQLDVDTSGSQTSANEAEITTGKITICLELSVGESVSIKYGFISNGGSDNGTRPQINSLVVDGETVTEVTQFSGYRISGNAVDANGFFYASEQFGLGSLGSHAEYVIPILANPDVFNPTTGVYTAPTDGMYLMKQSFGRQSGGARSQSLFRVASSGVITDYSHSKEIDNANVSVEHTQLIPLLAGDTVQILQGNRIYFGSNANTLSTSLDNDGNNYSNIIMGFRVGDIDTAIVASTPTATTFASRVTTDLDYGTEVSDLGSQFSTNTITVGEDGLHIFTLTTAYDKAAGTIDPSEQIGVASYFTVNGVRVELAVDPSSANGRDNSQNTILVRQLSAGDTVTAHFYNGSDVAMTPRITGLSSVLSAARLVSVSSSARVVRRITDLIDVEGSVNPAIGNALIFNGSKYGPANPVSTVAGKLYLTSAYSRAAGQSGSIGFNTTEEYLLGGMTGNESAGTYRFTVPVDGLYLIDYNVSLAAVSSDIGTINIRVISANQVEAQSRHVLAGGTAREQSFDQSHRVQLSAGNTISFQVLNGPEPITLLAGSDLSWFEVTKV